MATARKLTKRDAILVMSSLEPKNKYTPDKRAGQRGARLRSAEDI
ncbi:Uncharacterised protein [uncultured archaeon]|nr:Uncharacterised protein [uncultured archaeon]